MSILTSRLDMTVYTLTPLDRPSPTRSRIHHLDELHFRMLILLCRTDATSVEERCDMGFIGLTSYGEGEGGIK